MRDAPGVFGVERETLDILREGAVAGRSERAANADGGWRGRRRRRRIALRAGRSVIKRQRCRDTTAIRAGGIDVAIWIGGVGGKLLRRRGKRAAQHWFVNEVDPEL